MTGGLSGGICYVSLSQDIAESFTIPNDFHGHAISEPAVKLSVGLYQSSGVAMNDLPSDMFKHGGRDMRIDASHRR